jgi:hypothetical protein
MKTRKPGSLIILCLFVLGIGMMSLSIWWLISANHESIKLFLNPQDKTTADDLLINDVFIPLTDRGGSNPFFSFDHRFVFYVSPSGTLERASLTSGDEPQFSSIELPALRGFHPHENDVQVLIMHQTVIYAAPEISIVDMAKNKVTPLTTNAYGGTWTPDYSRITYLKNNDEQVELWEITAQGRNPTKLMSLDDIVLPKYVAWSNLGSHLFVQSVTGLNIYSYSSGFPTQVNVIPAAKNAIWSPDGWMIAYRMHEGDFDSLWVSNLDGGERRQVFQGGFSEVNWLPDGRLVFFTPGKEGGAACWALDPRTGSQELLADSSVVVWKPVGSIAVSPKGNALAFEAQDRQIWLLRLDGVDGNW